MNVYKTSQKYESERFTVRNLKREDSADLLEVYSDEKSARFFNGDNCHGDDFRYTTAKRMQEAVDFWLYSYEHGYFVRWSIVDNKIGKAVGTIELFHRDAGDEFDNCGLLRLDLASGYENAKDIKEIVGLILPYAFDLFYCDKIATKVFNEANERRSALKELGFENCSKPLVGDDGKEYYGYYVLNKR